MTDVWNSRKRIFGENGKLDRLTERFSNGEAGVLGCGDNCEHGFGFCSDRGECPTINELIDRLAMYEDLEEQGKLLRLPCKIGGTVYVIMNQRDNFSDALYKIVTATFFRYDMIKEVGKTVFLSKEKAEEVLEELERRN